MKNVIALIILVFITENVSSQIGATRSAIIQKNENYEMNVTDSGIDYISFVIEYENYDQSVACYLTKKKENEEQLCYRVLIIEPSSETNNWIKFFNDENFIKLDGMIWKDYEHSIVYEIEVKKGRCLVNKYYDTEL